jgi:protein-S-isoprenylcysteine O-methyltransferase Ste14
MTSQRWMNRKEIVWITIASILYIACFPANPLVLTGVIKVSFNLSLFIIGWIVWAAGMILVMAPIMIFPRRGGVPQGKSFVTTTMLVDTGIYAVVRHPQYLGGIISVFVTCIIWYPHWLFAVLGIVGSVFTCLSSREEDKYLIDKFGNDYVAYMKRVPGMNIFLGIVRVLKTRGQSTAI